MTNPKKPTTIKECKIQASLLLKALRSSDPVKAQQAARRLQRQSEFSTLPISEILKMPFKLKHALTAIARENGFASWQDLKMQINLVTGGFLNHWFANYAEAKTHLQTEGGFLLPYKSHYFVCDEHKIKQLGLDPEDPDWQSIGYDWAKPRNSSASQRLYKKWVEIQEQELEHE